MTYREGPVWPSLASLLDCTWDLQVTGPEPAMHFVPPDACVNFSVRFFEGTSEARYRMPNMAPLVTEALVGEHFVGVRFQPGAHRRVDLDQAIKSLSPISGEPSSAIQEAISNNLKPAAEARIAHIVDLIRQSKGLASIHAIAAEAGFSPRQVQRISLEELGMTPKQFARITRLQRAIRTLISGQLETLGDVAAEAGYADQSHMTREFAALTGISPTDYQRQRQHIRFELSHLF